MVRQPKREDRTDAYYTGLDRLLCASHWVDTLGNEHKIPQGLKVYYLYRWNRYSLFEKLDKSYYEKHTNVAKMLGISLDTIKRVYNPMLKDMGLIMTQGSFQDNNVVYIVYPIDNLDGWLINKEIASCKVTKQSYDKDENFTFENLKTLEHNKRVAKNIRTNTKEKFGSLPLDKIKELLTIERDYKELKDRLEEVNSND